MKSPPNSKYPIRITCSFFDMRPHSCLSIQQFYNFFEAPSVVSNPHLFSFATSVGNRAPMLFATIVAFGSVVPSGLASSVVLAKWFTELVRLFEPDGEDTRFARRDAREMDEVKTIITQGSPRRLGQPWAQRLDAFGVVIMRAARGIKIS
jgi:hypothetical protein